MSNSAADAGNLPRVLSVLELLTEDELAQLNQVVVAVAIDKADARAWNDDELAAGATGAPGEVVRGTISRMIRKSVTVVTEGGAQWRVRPDLLEAV
jgi:hypothetical protein